MRRRTTWKMTRRESKRAALESTGSKRQHKPTEKGSGGVPSQTAIQPIGLPPARPHLLAAESLRHGAELWGGVLQLTHGHVHVACVILLLHCNDQRHKRDSHPDTSWLVCCVAALSRTPTMTSLGGAETSLGLWYLWRLSSAGRTPCESWLSSCALDHLWCRSSLPSSAAAPATGNQRRNTSHVCIRCVELLTHTPTVCREGSLGTTRISCLRSASSPADGDRRR